MEHLFHINQPITTTAEEMPSGLKVFFEFYNLGESDIKHYAPDVMITKITEGMQTEVTVKADFEIFLEEYYKLYYEAAKDDNKKK